MLAATPEEKQAIIDYMNGQAPDLKVEFLQKVYVENVLSHQHAVWDVHTNVDRWWVITNPTNLYSQEQFPNMDLAVTFHVGLCLDSAVSEQRLPAERRTHFLRPSGTLPKRRGLSQPLRKSRIKRPMGVPVPGGTASVHV